MLVETLGTPLQMRIVAAMADIAEGQEYEIVSPPSDLRSKVRKLSAREARKFDPVKAAEDALHRLSRNFGAWMDDETRALTTAWDDIQAQGASEETVAPLFQAAHNIKGQALTLGFPLVGQVAASFCVLIENLPSPDALPMKLTGRFVVSIRAMVTEGAKDSHNKTGVELLQTLQSVTDEFLAQLPPRQDAD